jgi:hypothetical protein
MVNRRQVVRAVVFALLLSVFSAVSVSLAHGQDFSLTPSALQPAAVAPGGSSISTIDLAASGGFDSLVSLSCVVTSNQVTTDLPVCTVSPASQTPPADGPSVTVTTTGTTPAGLYSITLTGISGSLTHTVALTLSVVDLTADYTLSVLPTTATPSPVTAGSLATTIVTVTPIGSYTGQVTLACLSVSPIVAGAPVCAFQPPTVQVTSGIPPSSTLTITTFGTAVTTQLAKPRIFYALWLAVPGLALVGVGAIGSRRKKLMGLLLLMAVASGLLLMPGCSTKTTNGPNNEVTPNNTYIFTLTGVDENGAGPTNATTTTTTTTTGTTTTCSTTTTGCSAATVTLEVN